MQTFTTVDGKFWDEHDMEEFVLTILPQGIRLIAHEDQTVLNVLRDAGIQADAPCGGAGTCGKCKIIVDGKEMLSCQALVEGDMTVILP